MYFPIGWPRVLLGGRATRGHPVEVFRHRSRDMVIELRTHSVAFWHTRLCVLLSSYERSSECVEQHGTNIAAAIRPDGTILVIATSSGKLLFLRLEYDRVSNLKTYSHKAYSTREHGIFLQTSPHLEGVGEGRELEVVLVKYLTETAIVGGVVNLLSVGPHLLVTTGYGVLHRLSWEGCFNSSLTINLNHVPFASDLLPESRGQPINGPNGISSRQVVYSPGLHGFSLVLSDGRGAFLTGKSARYEPQSMQGVWVRGVADAVCTAINSKYRLLAFGKTNGSVEVYSSDDSTGEWTLAHTLQFTRRQFPETGVQLGEVQCVEWSIPDGMVVAVSWKNGGLSLWSVFGSLLLCSLGDQPGTPSPLNPHCTILETMCWSSDGYHLWMLPISGDKPPATPQGQGRSEDPENEGGGANQLLVMQFMRNSLVTNPVMTNHHHLLLQGSSRLYLNTSSSFTHHRRGVSSTRTASTGNRMVSGPQWKVIPLPSSYMVLNWPIQYSAVSENGNNLAVSGKAGFALYSSSRRKWKLFGNEVQEQGLICRGGLAWYHDVLVFPCRVLEKSEEVRFYSLHSNLDNSQLLECFKTTSPIIKLNLHGNHLLLASRDCHVTIIHLKLELLPTKGVVLNISKLHEMNLSKSLPSPWANTLVALVPSSIRTEPAHPYHPSSPTTPPTPCHKGVDSILFNFSGTILMIQRDLPNQFAAVTEEQNTQDEWTFSSPVCLAASVEMMWTPPLPATPPSSPDPTPSITHLSESLWLACGWDGVKVWLPLFPRDEGHLTFLSKRIMLTLPCSVYPQVVMFDDAVLFGLSHETAFSEKTLSNRNTFPFATIEKTTNIFLHHILRQLLRRNLGSHALQIAHNFSHLPYFSHVLELMLHEILEEEAPGSMPVPDALLPRVVEFIKQFPEFLETVGHCARKTEVALWQYLFAAVGNPRDLFEWCITDGRLQTAATYLIIIQNLEASLVSRQLATRLLDTALESNQWSLCRDLVRFLRAIGAGDTVESASPGLSAATPHKTQTPSSAGFSTSGIAGGAGTPSLTAPDLDRSAVMVAKDHLTSGNTSNCVSLSGDYKDASGKVIRRPHFLMDVDSKEEYFMELLLSRHARKLLTSHSLRDLGKFSAHLDFPLPPWLAREGQRAAKIEDFPYSLQQLHREFQWPLPPPSSYGNKGSPTSSSSLFSPASTIRDHTPKDVGTPIEYAGTGGDDESQHAETNEPTEGAEGAAIRRPHRPPNLDLSPSKAGEQEQHNVTLEPTQGSAEPDFDLDPPTSSTPTKHSGSVSERVSLVLKNNPSSLDLNLESSSTGDIMEESDWDLNSEVAVATGTGGVPLRGSTRAEKEIRYFADTMLEAGCVDWAVLLAMLLLDQALVSRVVATYSTNGCQLDRSVVTRLLRGMDDLRNWAESECTGYLHFLDAIQAHLTELNIISSQQSISSPLDSDPLTDPSPLLEEGPDGGMAEEGFTRSRHSSHSTDGPAEESTSMCVIS